MSKKNNPWNTQMEIPNFNVEYGDRIKSFCIESAIKNRGTKTKLTFNIDIELFDYLSKLYNDGYGLKVLARHIDISYSQIRSLFKRINIEMRKGLRVCTDKTKQFRSERIQGDKNPWFNWTDPENINNERFKNNSKGIQGRFYKNDGSDVWLRSSWEYIYAKWLEDNKYEWEYEPKNFKLSNGESYRPDFKIYENNTYYFVEIKGTYFNMREHKVEMFRTEYNEDIRLIKDIESYTTIGYTEELKLWKEYINENNKSKVNTIEDLFI